MLVAECPPDGIIGIYLDICIERVVWEDITSSLFPKNLVKTATATHTTRSIR